MLRVGEQLGVAAIIFLDDFLLVDGEVERAADADVVERLGVDAHSQKCAAHAEPFRPLQLWGALFQFVDRRPADAFENVELAGSQRGQECRLILDGAINHLVDERQLVLAAADLLLVPVDRVPRIGVGVALHEVGQHEWPGAVAVLPVGGAGVGHLLRIDW